MVDIVLMLVIDDCDTLARPIVFAVAELHDVPEYTKSFEPAFTASLYALQTSLPSYTYALSFSAELDTCNELKDDIGEDDGKNEILSGGTSMIVSSFVPSVI